MTLMDDLNKRAKKLDAWDISLIKMSAMLMGLFAANLFPQLLRVNLWWVLGLAILLAIRSIYVGYFKK